MKNIEEINKLIDAYECLLTEHQRDVIKMYYAEDLSLQEISEETSSSRSAVLDIIRRTEKILYDYESKLHLVEKDEKKYVMVTTACDNLLVVESIKRQLLENRLAAVIQVIDMKSNYRWKGKVYDEKEYLLLIKSKKIKSEEIKNVILSLHDYECCEVSVYDIADANKEWLSWIDEEVGE